MDKYFISEVNRIIELSHELDISIETVMDMFVAIVAEATEKYENPNYYDIDDILTMIYTRKVSETIIDSPEPIYNDGE